MRNRIALSVLGLIAITAPAQAQLAAGPGVPGVEVSPGGLTRVWLPGAVSPRDIEGNSAVANAPARGTGLDTAPVGLRDVPSWAPFGPSGADAASVAASPTAAGVVVAGIASSVGGGAIYRSTNSGGSWALATGTGTRTINEVEFAPSGTGWAATSDGLFRSTDNGQTWIQVALPIAGQVLAQDVAIDPTDSNTVWVGIGQFLGGTSTQVVFKTINGGTNWTDVSPPVSSGLGATVVAIDQTNTQRVYAAFSGNFGAGNELWITTNGGTSWVERSTGIPDVIINDIAFGPGPAHLAYIAGGQDFGSQYLGLYNTPDDGQLWNEMSGLWPSRAANAVAVDPSNPLHILVGTTRAGVASTIDGGNNWTFSAGGTGSYQVNDINFAPGAPATIYLGMGSVAVWKSTNGGTSFSPSSSGISNLEITSFAVNPLNTSEIAASYVGLNDGGIFISTNAGQSWTLSQAPLPRWQKVYFAPNGTLYGTHDGPLGRADDGLWIRNANGTWSNLGPGTPGALDNIGLEIQATPGPNPKILWGGYKWLTTFASRIWSYNRIAPNTWELEDEGVNQFEEVFSILWLEGGTGPDALAGIVKFGQTGAGHIRRSSDSGDTWNAAETGFGAGWDAWEIAQGPQNASTVYVQATADTGTANGTIYKSTDGGVTWTPRGTTPAARQFAADPRIPGTFYIHPTWTNTGAQRSTDDGASFQLFNTGFVNPGGARDMVYGGTVNGVRRLYAATSSGGFATNLGAPPCAADADGNGLIEPADVAAFVNVWFNSLTNGTLAGDFDGNGAVEPADVAAFVAAWFAALTSGC